MEEFTEIYLRYVRARAAEMKKTPAAERPNNWLIPSTRTFWRIDSFEEFCLAYIKATKPDSDLGIKFRQGRKIGTMGLVKKAIAKLLSENPKMKNPDLWKELSKKPPKGRKFFDNRIGKYIEGPDGATEMKYGRFCNVCGEVRKEITG